MINKYFLFTLILTTFFYRGLGQTSSKAFKLSGTINSITGVIYLFPIGDRTYYQNLNKPIDAEVKNNHFTIYEPCQYPYAFRIALKVNSKLVYLSDIFWVDPKDQKITCNIDSLRKTPVIYNSSMKELKKKFLAYRLKLKTFNNKIDRDSILLEYTKLNPDSFISLWKLIDAFSYNGYQPLYDSIFSQLSPTIKDTYTGKILGNKLNSAKIITIGHIFPVLNLYDSNGKKIIKDFNKESKYVLVDFWNSYCSPCIGQFDILKRLFSDYHDKGFNIIGISNENTYSISNWRKIIQEKKLTWDQFLDLNGQICLKMDINLFPTNFLIGQNGKIIAKNLSMVELSNFLKINLK